MSAYVVGTAKIKNPEKFAEYGEKFGPTIGPFGGQPVLRGQVQELLDGSAENNVIGAVKFPTIEDAKNWYGSDAYQSIVPIRDEGADVVMVLYAEPAG